MKKQVLTFALLFASISLISLSIGCKKNNPEPSADNSNNGGSTTPEDTCYYLSDAAMGDIEFSKEVNVFSIYSNFSGGMWKKIKEYKSGYVCNDSLAVPATGTYFTTSNPGTGTYIIADNANQTGYMSDDIVGNVWHFSTWAEEDDKFTIGSNSYNIVKYVNHLTYIPANGSYSDVGSELWVKLNNSETILVFKRNL